MPLPTPAENPNGLHRRYIVSKTDGTPVNPEAIYFVLRLDSLGDPLHVYACRRAIHAYAAAILGADRERGTHLDQLAAELEVLVTNLSKEATDERPAKGV